MKGLPPASRTVTQWLDIPGLPPLYGNVDFPSLVLGLKLIQLHGTRLAARRNNRPVASGGLVLGHPMLTLRATYLLDRRAFLVESGGHVGAPWHATIPVDLTTLLAYLATWLYTDHGQGFAFTEYESFEGDHQVNGFWSEAYGRLLGLPSAPPLPEPPRTIEQQRYDGLVAQAQSGWLLPEIDRLTAKLHEHRDNRALPF